jgi:predicted ArsR family transcriptional regulator
MDEDSAMAKRSRSEGGRTRTRILGLLEDSPAGMTADELAEALELHPNGVRRQLRALIEDGAVGATRDPAAARGRPATRYRAADADREAAAVRRLSRMLVALVSELHPDEALVEEFGRRQASDLASGEDGRTAILDLLTTLGFAPQETTGGADARAGRLEVVLGHCPFREAVREEGGEMVCVLHRGISRGLAELSPGGRLADFEVRDPTQAGCRLVAEGLRPPPPPA